MFRLIPSRSISLVSASMLSSTASSDSQAQRRLRSVSEIWPSVSGALNEICDGLSEVSASLNEGGSVSRNLPFRVERWRGAGTAARLQDRPGSPPPPPCGAA